MVETRSVPELAIFMGPCFDPGVTLSPVQAHLDVLPALAKP